MVSQEMLKATLEMAKFLNTIFAHIKILKRQHFFVLKRYANNFFSFFLFKKIIFLLKLS